MHTKTTTSPFSAASILSTKLLALALVLGGCGAAPSTSTVAGESPTPALPRDHWETIAPRCAGYPSKEHCGDGDMTLFGGLLCASGDQRGCDLVRDAQGADGRWWRSPRRNPGNLGSPNSFSRDMAMGVFLYLATTRDAVAARRWLNWIETNRPCVTANPLGDGCLVYGAHRFCADDLDLRCTVTPVNWAVMGRVFDALGLARNNEMRLYAAADDETLPLKARDTALGYELHLVSVEVLLKARLGVTRQSRLEAAHALFQRQPENPFFAYLQNGAADATRAHLSRLCPRHDSGDARRFQWSWERDTASQAWRESMGWDCLFLDNLLASTAFGSGG